MARGDHANDSILIFLMQCRTWELKKGVISLEEIPCLSRPVTQAVPAGQGEAISGCRADSPWLPEAGSGRSVRRQTLSCSPCAVLCKKKMCVITALSMHLWPNFACGGRATSNTVKIVGLDPAKAIYILGRKNATALQNIFVG